MPSINDNFADAIEVVILSDGGTYTSDPHDNRGNTTEPGEPDVSASDALSMWFAYTPATSGTATFDTSLTTAITSTDTYMAIHTGDDFASMVTVASDDDGGGSATSRIADLSVTAGETYWIQIGGYGFAQFYCVLRVVGPATASGDSGVSLIGALAALTLSAPAGALSTVESVALTGSAALVDLSAPAGAVTTSESVSVALVAPTGHISLSAPAGSVGSRNNVSLTGSLAAFGLSAPSGVLSTSASLSGSVATLTLSAPAGAFRFSDALVLEDAMVRLRVPVIRRSANTDRHIREFKHLHITRIMEE